MFSKNPPKIQTLENAKVTLQTIFAENQGKISGQEQIRILLSQVLDDNNVDITNFLIIAALLNTDFKNDAIKILQNAKSESSFRLLIFLAFGFPTALGTHHLSLFNYFKENQLLVKQILSDETTIDYFDLSMRMRFVAKRSEKPFSELQSSALKKLVSLPETSSSFSEKLYENFEEENIIKIMTTLPMPHSKCNTASELFSFLGDEKWTAAEKIWKILCKKIEKESKSEKHEGEFQHTLEFLLLQGVVYEKKDDSLIKKSQWNRVLLKRNEELFLSDVTQPIKKLCEAKNLTLTQLVCLKNTEQLNHLICLWNIVMVQLQNEEMNAPYKSITIYLFFIISALDRNDFKTAIEIILACINSYSTSSINQTVSSIKTHLLKLLNVEESPADARLDLFEWGNQYFHYRQKSILSNLKRECNEFFNALFKNEMAAKTFKEIFQQSTRSNHPIKPGSHLNKLFPDTLGTNSFFGNLYLPIQKKTFLS